MSNSINTEAESLRDAHSYSSTVRSILGFTAFAVTLMPIPIIYFRLLPAYQRHAWFLLFYTPFLCLITLCYLFYVRDSLARAIFANVLDPPPPPDPYYREPLGDRMRRGFRRIKATVLLILPALLVLTSMYCVSRYFGTIDRSVALSVESYIERTTPTETGAVTQERESTGRRKSSRATRPAGPAAPDSATLSAPHSLPLPSDTAAVRKHVLLTTEIDEIPQLARLTALFVGAFVALLIAVSLMALKEYAKEALGLSEHELMFGRYRRATVEE